MAALGSSAVVPGCLARCFLRQTRRPRLVSSPPAPGTVHQSFNQRCRLHSMAVARSSPIARLLLGWRCDGLVADEKAEVPYCLGTPAISVLVPVESFSMDDIPAKEAPYSTLELETAPVLSDTTPILTESVMQQQLVDVAPPTAAEVLQVAASEPTLVELGLAGHTPVGFIQSLLEFMHVDLGLPWWGAIVAEILDS
ncbi:hypothetical protein NHX12_013739 [Muraenolepis orangiensis]|uniref:Uncharacterized protein n=1 Tax=Muraenolepis orangiensis TaxID=630683 RepID=A0A9Q0DC37_9TELE|nr:hypothetical protein NHX12_013739 [Muraenolepis orangiensis]